MIPDAIRHSFLQIETPVTPRKLNILRSTAYSNRLQRSFQRTTSTTILQPLPRPLLLHHFLFLTRGVGITRGFDLKQITPGATSPARLVVGFIPPIALGR